MSTPDSAGIDIVLLIGSAGGLDALCAVLSQLPVDYAVPIVVQQHLGGHTSVLPAILARRTDHDVRWAVDGERVAPGVIVCPPDVYMELRPGGRCVLRASERSRERRFDVLLTSAAASYGPGALAVVLSGSGRDGATGVTAMKHAGGIVIAQAEGTAEYASMPHAAALAGADAVLPVGDIGRFLTELVARRGATRADVDAALHAAGGTRRSGSGDGEPKAAPQATGATADNAGSRGEAAGRRVVELQQRRAELASGSGATAQSVAMARARAGEAADRAERARRVAAERLAALEQAKVALVQDFHQE